jgi:hypothetical protein
MALASPSTVRTVRIGGVVGGGEADGLGMVEGPQGDRLADRLYTESNPDMAGLWGFMLIAVRDISPRLTDHTIPEDGFTWYGERTGLADRSLVREIFSTSAAIGLIGAVCPSKTPDVSDGLPALPRHRSGTLLEEMTQFRAVSGPTGTRSGIASFRGHRRPNGIGSFVLRHASPSGRRSRFGPSSPEGECGGATKCPMHNAAALPEAPERFRLTSVVGGIKRLSRGHLRRELTTAFFGERLYFIELARAKLKICPSKCPSKTRRIARVKAAKDGHFPTRTEQFRGGFSVS